MTLGNVVKRSIYTSVHYVCDTNICVQISSSEMSNSVLSERILKRDRLFTRRVFTFVKLLLCERIRKRKRLSLIYAID